MKIPYCFFPSNEKSTEERGGESELKQLERANYTKYITHKSLKEEQLTQTQFLF